MKPTERGGPKGAALVLSGGHVLTVTAPAKVNLFLGVGPVRADGFHSVVTVLHALELADEVRVRRSEGLTFTCTPDVGVPEECNLAFRAAAAMSVAFGRDADVAIALTKATPQGAGLGGGSSDAAAVVAGLARMWSLDRHDPRAVRVAAGLGADVPFFLTSTGAALMGGRGDELVRELPGLAGAPVALVRPHDPVPTAAAYAAFDETPQPAGDPHAVISALEAGDALALARALDNNLERASAAVVPAVADALAWTRESPGVSGAAVAGSGSAVFALCEDTAHAEMLAAAAADRGWWGCATRLRARGVETHGRDVE